jgi:hypothetical protein
LFIHSIDVGGDGGYALGTRLLAAAQYRLAQLAGTGRLEPDESMRLQQVFADAPDDEATS